jgi:hypothetical protein
MLQTIQSQDKYHPVPISYDPSWVPEPVLKRRIPMALTRSLVTTLTELPHLTMRKNMQCVEKLQRRQ